jgi:hypothetical protein
MNIPEKRKPPTIARMAATFKRRRDEVKQHIVETRNWMVTAL